MWPTSSREATFSSRWRGPAVRADALPPGTSQAHARAPTDFRSSAHHADAPPPPGARHATVAWRALRARTDDAAAAPSIGSLAWKVCERVR